MKLLLDTHIWLWSLLEPGRLVPRVARALEDTSHELWLSPVSIWELLILTEKQRLRLPGDREAWITQSLSGFPLQEATLTYAVALETEKIRLPHRDPADRLIAATARVYDLTLVTADERLLASRAVRTLANR